MSRAYPETETSVLAMAMQSPEAFKVIMSLTSALHFSGINQSLYVALKNSGPNINPAVLVDSIAKTDAARSEANLLIQSLKFYDTDFSLLDSSINKLDDALRFNQFFESQEKLLRDLKRLSDPAGEIAANFELKSAKIIQSCGASGEAITFERATLEGLEKANQALERGEVGIKTGIPALDELTGGLLLGQHMVLFAQAGAGKTALMMQAVTHISRYEPVAVISLELNAADLSQRVLSALSGVFYSDVQAGKIPDNKKDDFDAAVDLAKSLKIFLAPDNITTFEQAQAWLRLMHYQHGARVLVLDNILSLDYHGKTEYDHVTHVASASQNLAKSLNVAVLNLHHSNTDEQPNMFNVHGAKAIARHSASILSLWFDSNYNRTELTEHKGRTTGKGTKYLSFIGKNQRFTSLKDAW